MNLICGINPVLEALGAGTRHFDRLLVVKGLRNRRISEAIGRAGQIGIPLRFEARETLDRMAGGIPHQGLIAVVSAKPVITVEKLLEEARTPALVVVLDGVEDPRNLGAILRTVEAAGADGVLLPERHSAGLSETVSRASAGGLEHVRVASVGNVVQALEALKARGLWVVGFDASGTERWDAVDYRHPMALVLGGEGRGIRRLVREHCDHLVSIPLFGHVNSLNVSVAAGVALYEVVRQRGAVPSFVRPIPARPAAGPRIVGPAAGDAESDPGLVARQARDDEADEEADETRAQPVRLAEDVDHPAWAGPTVLKPVGPQREHGGSRRHGRDTRGRARAQGPRRGERGAPPHAEGAGPAAAGPGGPAPPPHGPHGRRRHRHRGARPGGGPPSDEQGPARHQDAPDRHGTQGDGGAREGPRAEEGPQARPPEAGPADAQAPGGGSGHRRRRRRRRH